jgi:sialate O-acetylesterase
MKKLVVSLSLLCWLTGAKAAVTLAKIFTSNMVLQRDKEIKIWGWADKGEIRSVRFNGQSVRSKADKNGN